MRDSHLLRRKHGEPDSQYRARLALRVALLDDWERERTAATRREQRGERLRTLALRVALWTLWGLSAAVMGFVAMLPALPPGTL